MARCPRCAACFGVDAQTLYECPRCGYQEEPSEPKAYEQSPAYRLYLKESEEARRLLRESKPEAPVDRFDELMAFVLGPRPEDS